MRSLTVPRAEHEQRIDTLLEAARDDGYDGVVLFTAVNIQYVTGCYHLPRERPFVLGLSPAGTHVVVPQLEAANARRGDYPHDEVYAYHDYPQGDPMALVAEMCESLGIAAGRVAVDEHRSPRIMGYEGPRLDEVIPGTVEMRDYVPTMREVKSDTEIALLEEASTWGNLGHRMLADEITPGRLPMEVSATVEGRASRRMLQALDGTYRLEGRTRLRPVECSFTSSAASEEPHNVNQKTPVQYGDSLVTIVIGTVGGYGSELERTMFLGEYSDEQEHYFELMREAGEVALDTIGPGTPYSAVDTAVTEYFEEQGVAAYAQHHVGHSVGLEKHERPFLDRGMEGELRENEVFTVEPGLYVPEVGGFRHSDTVRVTASGVERLTYYPRDIESLTIPA